MSEIIDNFELERNSTVHRSNLVRSMSVVVNPTNGDECLISCSGSGIHVYNLSNSKEECEYFQGKFFLMCCHEEYQRLVIINISRECEIYSLTWNPSLSFTFKEKFNFGAGRDVYHKYTLNPNDDTEILFPNSQDGIGGINMVKYIQKEDRYEKRTYFTDHSRTAVSDCHYSRIPGRSHILYFGGGNEFRYFNLFDTNDNVHPCSLKKLNTKTSKLEILDKGSEKWIASIYSKLRQDGSEILYIGCADSEMLLLKDEICVHRIVIETEKYTSNICCIRDLDEKMYTLFANGNGATGDLFVVDVNSPQFTHKKLSTKDSKHSGDVVEIISLPYRKKVITGSFDGFIKFWRTGLSEYSEKGDLLERLRFLVEEQSSSCMSIVLDNVKISSGLFRLLL